MALQDTMICQTELELFDLSDNRTLQFLEGLINISNGYARIHKWLSMIICCVGILANLVHCLVLRSAPMNKSAVNRILSYIAICDLLTMLSYVIFNIRFGFMVDPKNPPIGYSLPWIAFLLGHVVCSIALHTITLYLSAACAWIRFKVLDKLGSKWLHESAAGPIFLVVVVSVCLLCVPTFLVHSIIRVEADDGSVLYTVGLAEFTSLNTCFVFKANLWLTGIAFKVIPCILLFVFTFALLYKLDITRRRRRLITSGHSLAARRNDAHSDRTTKLLAVCLAIFLATELPQGILSCLNARFPNDIHQFVYLSLGDFLDLLSLVNANTIWILYPLLSSQYRHSLRDYFQCFREKARSRLTSATKLTLHGDTSTLRFLDDRDVLL